MSETDVVRRAMAVVRVEHPGGIWWRQNSGRKGRVRFASTNLPDLVGVNRLGQAGFVECKTATGRLTWEQWDFLKHMATCGAWCRVYVENELHKLHSIPKRNMPTGQRERHGKER